jgi:hypothetical protein
MKLHRPFVAVVALAAVLGACEASRVTAPDHARTIEKRSDQTGSTSTTSTTPPPTTTPPDTTTKTQIIGSGT